MTTRRLFVAIGPRGKQQRRSRRFDADALPSAIRAWREQARTELRAESPEPLEGFAKDAATYLEAVAAMPTIRERKRDMALWVTEFGATPRREITSAMIRAVRDRWLTVGPRRRQAWVFDAGAGKRVRRDELVEGPLAASTVNHRLRALENFYTVLEGRHGYNPVRDVPEAKEPDARPRAIPAAVHDAILGSMQDCATKARLEVILATGLPHATLMRLTPADFDAKGKTVWVPGRKKGQGTAGRLLPLTTAGVRALKQFARWDAWGPFSTSAMLKVWRAACRRVKVFGVVPYDLRHTMATETLVATGDLRATQLLMGHSTPKLTERYANASVLPILVAAAAKLDKFRRKRSLRR